MNQNVKPDQVCDIVLKGGITSGVVYPLALVSLSQKYRFSSIGGTSAGAIAAAAAAAAEFGRQTGSDGFARLAKIPDEIGPNLLALFQPTPSLKPAYDVFIAALKAKTKLEAVGAISLAAIRGYWGSALAGVALGLIIMVLALAFGGAGWFLLGLLLALVGLVVATAWRLWTAVGTELVANDYGLCPGIRQPYSKLDAFTDWLARLIDEAAGRGKDTDRPLTFGDLAALPDGKAIQLAMMTTSLMEQRPYTLPMEAHLQMESEAPKQDRRFVFEKSEWDKLFPRRIMTFLTKYCDRFVPPGGESGEYYHFPDAAKLPLVVGARMSLSFPGLICAVPLWRQDFTLSTETERNKLRRCLFSDGGLSSNFPIHFFDHLLPGRPTFAISLDEYDPKRNRDDARVWLPLGAGGGAQIPIQPFEGLGAFLMRLLDSAKNWQDNLQSVLPGYRERIAHVVLKPDEGGLNLTMEEAKIKKLVGYGKEAGETLCAHFDLDAHRWRRFLVAMARMEETLDEVELAYAVVPGGPESFAHFLARYPGTAKQYKQDPKRLAEMLVRGKELADCGAKWRTKPTIRDGNIPKPATNLRISPKP
jgi:hypothetical protein